MKRYDIINKYIEKYNYKTYLEIGTQKNATFDRIQIKKTSVDPDYDAKADFMMTSDQFFAQVSDTVTWDIIFIDGLHHADQVYNDINNALKHLSDNGTIVCHDMNPIEKKSQQVPRIQRHWNGDCWKAFVQIRQERDDLEIFVIDTDEGCGIIRKGTNKLLPKGLNLIYKELEANRKEWLSLTSVEKWMSSMGEDMSYKIIEEVPYGIDKNYGKACNEFFERIPNDNWWGIVRDTDCLTLTPSHIHMVKQAINMHPDTGMFIATTNRVGQKRQIYDMSLFEDMDIKKHRRIALKLAEKPLSFTEFNIPISGYYMIIKKATWKEIGGFKNGILGVDTNISNKIRRSGKKILMIDNLYIYHYYRALEGIQWKEHLK